MECSHHLNYHRLHDLHDHCAVGVWGVLLKQCRRVLYLRYECQLWGPTPPRKAAVVFPARAQCIAWIAMSVQAQGLIFCGSMPPLHGAMIPTAQNWGLLECQRSVCHTGQSWTVGRFRELRGTAWTQCTSRVYGSWSHPGDSKRTQRKQRKKARKINYKNQ